MHTLTILIFLNLYSYTTIWHHSIPSFCHFFLLSSSIFSTLFSGSTVTKIKKKSRFANIWKISCKKLLIFLSIRISSGDEVELHLDELICSIRMNFVAQKKKTILWAALIWFAEFPQAHPWDQRGGRCWCTRDQGLILVTFWRLPLQFNESVTCSVCSLLETPPERAYLQVSRKNWQRQCCSPLSSLQMIFILPGKFHSFLFHRLPTCLSFKSEYLEACESPRMCFTNEVLLDRKNVVDSLKFKKIRGLFKIPL